MTSILDSLSYYRATQHPFQLCPALHGDVQADVCVIGAGYSGLSAALELAEKGYKVVVLEAKTVGYGASGRNGGQICTGFSSGQEKIVTQLGAEGAAQAFGLAEEAKRLLVSRIERYNIDCDLTWGYLHCIPKARGFKGLQEWKAELDALGVEGATLLNRDELATKIGTNIYHGALREQTAGHLHPLNYCLGLARAAQSHSATIYENSAAVEISTGDKPWARTTGGKVSAKFLILAGNAYLGKLSPELYSHIMPVGSYIVATEPLGENRAKSLIQDNEAVANTNFIVDYFRRSADNRLLFGGRASYSTLAPRDLSTSMRPRMLAVFPQLDDVKIDYAWGGYIAITANRIPDCGRLSPTTYYAHGYSGQGVALAGFYGKLMAEAVRGQAERFDLLANIKHMPFPGGPVRTPLLVAAMLYYRMRDALA